MLKTFTKSLFVLWVFAALTSHTVFAQTITIGSNFVSGNYTPGSSIGVPFETSGTCINSDNQFNLYLANASGTILSNTPIGTVSGFYSTFVNGVIPSSTPPGTYTVVVKSTSPVSTSAPSPTFTVTSGTAVTASTTGPSINSSNPNIFGSCAGQANSQYFFSNNSGTASATANFFNESSQTSDGTVVLAPTGSFTAQATNYTIMVQTSNGASIATQAYYLINNVVNNSFGSTNNNTVCLTGSGGTLTYNLDITSANGLQKNFPGNTYQVTWGDGTSTVYDICELIASNGQISHNYTSGSCGHTANGQTNAFEVDVQPDNPYCGTVGTRITSYARIIRSPTNSFTAPTTACTNSTVTFVNTSDPGQDASATANSCLNPNALYTWSVDGTVVLANAHQNQNFTYTFTTNGNHTVTLALQGGSAGPCTAQPVTQTICIQNAPKPAFTLPATACLSGPVTPTDQSVVDQGCNTNPYLWTVTGPASVTFVGGTNNGSHQPQIQFSAPGVYTVTLSISSASCATATVSHTINVDGPPTITMSANTAVCGSNLTYNFNPNPGATQTTVTGTAVATAGTYSWTVTGGAYSFVGGTSASSQYPQINFTDFATYTIQVTETNSCGSATKQQQITFQNAPTVTITPSANPICPGSSVTLTANINGAYNSLQWTSTGTGVFSTPTSLTTTYTPSQAEINAGAANISINVKTSLAGQCANIVQNITINIYPVDNITSALTKQICTGSPVNYNITSTVPNSTYTWTAALTSGTATGFATTGSGSTINDVLTNNGPADAVVTYTITPTDPHGCTGPASTLKVTVKALSSVTATPANSTICSGSNANISLSPSIPNTTYTWTSTVTGSITNNSQQSTPTATNVINDVLNNTGTTAGSVTYTITPYNATCPGPPTTVTINVQPLPVPANAGQNDEQCNITTYTLNGNTPPAGAGKWTIASGPAGASFTDATKPNTAVNGLVPGTYQFTWTITIPGCQSSSNTVTIKNDAASVGGTTSGAATVCAGTNNGNVTLSGQVGNILRWESSTNNGTTWNSIPNTTTTQQYVNLTVTTQYRAVIQSGVCALAFSSPTTITVNQPPVQANAGSNDEVCNTTTYTLNGNSPAPYSGHWTVTAGPAGAAFADATQPNTTVSGLIPGNIYQFTWTITAPAPCATSSSSVVITDDAPTAGGTTGTNATVCSGSNSGSITLSGQVGKIIRWESSTDNGATWSPIANTGTIQQYTNLTITTQYRAFIQSGVCTGAFSSVTTITVNQPAVQANAGPNQELCNTTTYTLQGNNPAPGAGQWTQTAGPAGAIFSDPTQPNAVVSGLIPGNTYQFTWSITPQAPCTSNSSTVTIVIDSATVSGNTATSTSVCAGSNSGTITLTGQTGKVIRWEFSTDNGTTWTAIANTSASQQYLNLNTTTQYRAVVQSGVCSVQFSTVTTITVNQPVVPANAGGNQSLCGATSATLQGNDPTPFAGTWTQTGGPAATIVSPNSGQTQVTGLVAGNDYTFVWTIQGQPPCANSSSTTQIHDAADVTPSFTADKTDNCGTYTVNFTNTSTTLTGTTFLWNFGDGATSSAVSPSHTFIQRSDGKDTTYTVSLTVVNNCAPHPPFTLAITVRPKDPIAAILPDQLNGCSPFAIRVANKSPGNNTGYDFYLYDGPTLVQQIHKTDKSTAVFNPVSSPPAASKTFTVYMVTTGFCNNTTESTHVPVTVSPPTVTAQMFIQGSVNKGCAPLAVTFVNNSSGGDSYFYTIYDVNNQPIAHLIAGTANYPYTFTTTGTYFVTITGTNNCSSSESPKTRVDVYANPQPQFDADVRTGCSQITVNFKNLTPDDTATPATSLSYVWDFGDNTQSTAFTPAPHVYSDKNNAYTVTLTATNAGSGCSNTVIKNAFIVVNSPPAPEFTERPDSVTSIPNYTFAFRDQSTGGPTKWSWSFGDGKSSPAQNPSHTYPDTGLYKVTLTVTGQQGCDSTISHHVRITGVPGQLFLPNAFEPDGSVPELRVFKAKGSGIKQWHMQIFNNYSQLIWETTKLDDKGAPVDGWDGTINGSPAPQGVYVWQVSATFINGDEWKGNSYNGSLPKRVGVIHLIR